MKDKHKNKVTIYVIIQRIFKYYRRPLVDLNFQVNLRSIQQRRVTESEFSLASANSNSMKREETGPNLHNSITIVIFR